jgi:hypothetical protein
VGSLLGRTEWRRRRRFSEEAVRVKGVEEMDLGYQKMSRMTIPFSDLPRILVSEVGNSSIFRGVLAKVKQLRHPTYCDVQQNALISYSLSRFRIKVK